MQLKAKDQDKYRAYLETMAISASEDKINGRQMLCDMVDKFDQYPLAIKLVSAAFWMDQAGEMFSPMNPKWDKYLHLLLLRAAFLSMNEDMPTMPKNPKELDELSLAIKDVLSATNQSNNTAT